MRGKQVFAIGKRHDAATTVWIVRTPRCPIRGPWRLQAVVSRS
jgi:hypothetical protein